MMIAPVLIKIDHLSAGMKGNFMLRDISLSVREGDCWAITGDAGSGKSTLLSCIRNYKYYPDNIRFHSSKAPRVEWIGHQHYFKDLCGQQSFYYQQRFNASESEDTKTVLDELLSEGGDRKVAIDCLRSLRIETLQHTPLLQLSNGEHKRFQIAQALFRKADWLLLDDPFTGLDQEAREMLTEILISLMGDGMHILLVTKEEMPPFVTHVAILENGRISEMLSRKDFLSRKQISDNVRESFRLPKGFEHPVENDFIYAVRMNNVHVRYGDRDILSEINWQVKKGERWNISGPNGSGKSTLLSLITADNPQAFANDIYLFDRKRGTGESIWDIKRRIGYVSPEMHYYFDKQFSCFNIVASGLFDTIGLFRKLNAKQRHSVEECLHLFKIEHLADKPLISLSQGIQRWVLLARAVVKNPPLLILDEPCQGLDPTLRHRFLSLIEALYEEGDRTLIYVTHVQEEIPDCVTHFLKLQNGKIKETKYDGKEYNGNSGRRNRARSYQRSY